ncbi:hypothetical protein V6N13_023242 [Hibiscus sabdariffa]
MGRSEGSPCSTLPPILSNKKRQAQNMSPENYRGREGYTTRIPASQAELNKRCSAFSLPILPTLVIDGALVGLHVQDKVEASSLEGSRKRLVFPRRYF